MSLYQCLSECRGQLSEKQTEAETTLEPRDIIYTVFIPSGGEGHSIRVTSTSSQQVAQEAQGAKEEQPFEELVPAPYHDYKDVFSKEAFNKLCTSMETMGPHNQPHLWHGAPLLPHDSTLTH